MKKLTLWLPALFMGAVIFLSSQLFDVPKYTPLFAFFGHVKTVAHVVLYFALGFVVARLLAGTLHIGSLGVIVLASALCVAYGASDEIHQTFVEGRTANIFDIVRDFVGGTLGALVYVGCAWVARSLRTTSSQSPSGIGLIFGQAAVTVVVSLLITVPTVIFSDSIAAVFRSISSEVNTAVRSDAFSAPDYALAAAVGGAGGDQAPTREKVSEVSTKVERTNRPEVEEPEVKEGIAGAVEAKAEQEVNRHVRTDALRNDVSPKTGSLVVSAVETMLKGVSQGGRSSGKDHRHLVAKVSGKNSGPASDRKSDEDPAADFRPELLAVVVNPANPVSALTTSQVRKIFTGEHTNWSQVGGDDVPITVLIVHAGPRDPGYFPENVLKASPTPHAVTLRYASFIFPRVDKAKGAVAFVPVSVKAQLGFMEKHEAIKLLALKNRPQSPAVKPSRMAINLGSYPIVVGQPHGRSGSGSRTTVSLAR